MSLHAQKIKLHHFHEIHCKTTKLSTRGQNKQKIIVGWIGEKTDIAQSQSGSIPCPEKITKCCEYTLYLACLKAHRHTLCKTFYSNKTGYPCYLFCQSNKGYFDVLSFCIIFEM